MEENRESVYYQSCDRPGHPPSDAGFCYSVEDDSPTAWWEWCLWGGLVVAVVVPWVCGMLWIAGVVV